MEEDIEITMEEDIKITMEEYINFKNKNTRFEWLCFIAVVYKSLISFCNVGMTMK